MFDVKMSLTMKFQLWLLKKICRDFIIQGSHHFKIKTYYKVMSDVARNYFTEDNKPTLDGLLIELHQESL